MEVSCNDVSFKINLIEHTKDGNKYHVSIKIPMSYGWIDFVDYNVQNNFTNLSFRLKHEKNEDNYCYFSNDVFLKTSALYSYDFSYKINGEIRKIQALSKTNNNEIKYNRKWKMSVNFEVPNWAKGKIMYHIFVDRFNRGSSKKISEMPRRHIHNSWDEEVFTGPDENNIWNNDFYGGDLLGIIDKLDYIKSLGTEILYLSPIVYSQSNHRYDTADYEKVDPYVGVNEDLKKLCDAAHKRGIRVILDAVFNHTGNDSKYFNEYGTFDEIGAYQSLDSAYASFYKYYIVDGRPSFDYWWGMKNLPVCNGYSKAWQKYITGENGIIDQWFKLGIDGLRLDVADELTDEFISLIRTAVLRNKKDGFIIGEVWKNPMRMNRGYLASGIGMDTVMNYNFISSLIKYFRYGEANELFNKIKEIQTEYPNDSILSLMNFTSTQDMTRAINYWDNSLFDIYGEWPWNLKSNDYDFCKKYKLVCEQYEKARDIYMTYIYTLALMPGNLSIFYGDEVGLQGLGNLVNRRTFPWNNIDYCLLDFFKYIGYIRNNERFLEQANFEINNLTNNIFSFERKNDRNSILVMVNRTDQEQDIIIPSEYQNYEKVYTLKKGSLNKLKPYGGIAIKKSTHH